MVKIWIRIKRSDPHPYQIEQHDPDPYQSEKKDPDPDQKGLDPQHCSGEELPRLTWKKVHSDLEEEELPVRVHSVEGLVAAVLCDGLRDVQDIIVGHRSGRTRPDASQITT